MTPMFTLFIGIVAFIGLIAAGSAQSWPFEAGVLICLAGCIGALVWSLWFAFGDVKPPKDTTP